MIAPQKNINIKSKRVLLAPLDWGLGHTTRCIPVIQQLMKQGCDVLLAAENNSAALLRQEFPYLTIIPLPGYRISYTKNKLLFSLKIFTQVPKIIKAIRYEHRWLKQIIAQYKIDIVISDNRYGLFNKTIASVFITHQLAIQTGNVFSNKLIQIINYSLIKKFTECWVPDEVGSTNLAGKLSHPYKLPMKEVKYIGILSRCKLEKKEKNIDLLVIISGPEPQRTALENILLLQMETCVFKMVLVRGLPAATQPITHSNNNLEVYDHLAAAELNTLIQSSKIVIARSGYSTIMDLAMLQQAAILIPTPGQTEQEYLAKYLSDKKYCIAAKQAGFNLKEQLIVFKNEQLIGFPILENNRLAQTISWLL